MFTFNKKQASGRLLQRLYFYLFIFCLLNLYMYKYLYVQTNILMKRNLTTE